MAQNQEDVRPADIAFAEADIEYIDLAEDEIIVDGERLTEERADRITADVLEKGRRHNAGLIPGGKSLSGGNKHSPVVQVRVSESTRKKLRQIAESRKMSVSKLSRQILDEFVHEHEAR